MFFSVSTYAQKTKGKPLHWIIAAELPILNGQDSSLGYAGPITGIHEDRLIVAGGANFPDALPWNGGKKEYYDQVYVYRKKGNHLHLDKQVYKLPTKLAYTANCSTPQGIVVAGGENENGISNKVYLIRWDKNKKVISIDTLPSLPVALTNASATFYDDKVFIAGGETATKASQEFYQLNFATIQNGWSKLPALPQPVSHAVLVTQQQHGTASIFLIGGRKKNDNGISDLYNSVFRFDIQKKQWEEKKPLPIALSAGTGLSVNENNIMVFGGDKGETFHKTELLIAAIKAETDENRKKELIQQKNHLQATHPGFSKNVLLYNAKTNDWKAIGEIPFPSPVTTTALLWDKHIIIPSGEIRAGVRTPQILMAKLRRWLR